MDKERMEHTLKTGNAIIGFLDIIHVLYWNMVKAYGKRWADELLKLAFQMARMQDAEYKERRQEQKYPEIKDEELLREIVEGTEKMCAYWN